MEVKKIHKRIRKAKKSYKYLFSTAVTLLAITIGSFASVFIQESEENDNLFYWIYPINILKFAETQFSLSAEDEEIEISLLEEFTNCSSLYNYEDIKTYFVLDISPSLKVSDQLKDYLYQSPLTDSSVGDELIKTIEDAPSSISLYTAIALNYEHPYDVIIYNGEYKNYKNIKEIDFIRNQKKEVEVKIDSIEFYTKNITESLIYLNKKLKDENQKFSKNDIKTDISKMLSSSIQRMEGDKLIINLISDFDHDSRRKFNDVKNEIKSVFQDYKSKIHQINLFIISDKDEALANVDIIEEFQNSSAKTEIHYHPYEYKENITSIEKSIDSYVSISFYNEKNIEFYRPFKSKFGRNYFRAKLKVYTKDTFKLQIKKDKINKEEQDYFKLDLITKNSEDDEIFLNAPTHIYPKDSLSSLIFELKEDSNSIIQNSFLQINDNKNNYNLKYRITLRDKLPKSLTFFFLFFYTISFISGVGWAFNTVIDFFENIKNFKSSIRFLIYDLIISSLCIVLPVCGLLSYIKDNWVVWITISFLIIIQFNLLVSFLKSLYTIISNLTIINPRRKTLTK